MIRFFELHPVLCKAYGAVKNKRQAEAVKFQVFHWIFLKTNENKHAGDFGLHGSQGGDGDQRFVKVFNNNKVQAPKWDKSGVSTLGAIVDFRDADFITNTVRCSASPAYRLPAFEYYFVWQELPEYHFQFRG